MNGGRRDATAGIVLILLGLFFLLRHRLPLSGPGPILLIIGAAFFLVSAMRAFRGPLLPAGVCLGLGAGFLLRDPLERWMPAWGALLAGLGAGFLLVAAIDARMGRRGRRPAPLVPGVVLLAIAAGSAVGRLVDVSAIARSLAVAWPWLLVALGALLVIMSLRARTVGKP
jgi:hypothetical protein